MMSLKLCLPIPPSINSYYHYRGARRFISKRGLEFRAQSQLSVPTDHKTIEGRCDVYIAFYAPDKRRRDLDNIAKATLDFLTHAKIYNDDSQIDKLTIERMPVIKNDGHIVVTITQIN